MITPVNGIQEQGTNQGKDIQWHNLRAEGEFLSIWSTSLNSPKINFSGKISLPYIEAQKQSVIVEYADENFEK